MEIKFILNGKQTVADVEADTVLLDLLRKLGCYSVKCGCETTNCGLCTVWVDGKSRLSCSILAAGMEGKEITTLEGVQKEAEEFGAFLAEEGAEQCGFCSPGFIMNVLAMFRELENPTLEEIKEYLAGNLCRCTGYMGQLRAIRKYALQVHGKEVSGEPCSITDSDCSRKGAQA
ncbi:MAG: 2Fe-2S iron-sulfur cluster-binding protein [Lachnospiraceae bacterium]|nr:2Fe-2S iron-sulfur cluster-binding protein [Lachnospiraceae bacterium]